MRSRFNSRRRAATVLAVVLTASLAGSAAFADTSESPTVSLTAGITPSALPRADRSSVQLHLNTTLGSNDGKIPPKVTTLTIGFNRAGKISNRGLPTCSSRFLEGITTEAALQGCRRALVGHGAISGTVEFPDRAPFSAIGSVHAFNGRANGRDAILMHVEVFDPAHVVFVIPMVAGRAPGDFGTTFTVSVPAIAGGFGTITGLDLTMGRKYRFKGKRRSFLSASCPAPSGLQGGVFPLAQASYLLETGKTLSATAIGSCRAKSGGAKKTAAKPR